MTPLNVVTPKGCQLVVYFLNSSYFSGFKKKLKKDVQEKGILEKGASTENESNNKTENEGKQDKRYILFVGKTSSTS